jgi:uncharacterized protein (DUF1697 family)
MATTRQAAFLRGINVGRNNRIAMADLRGLVEGLGYTDVSTHLQSGNVLYTASVTPTKAAVAITVGIEKSLGLKIPVVARSRTELAAAIAHDPFGEVAHDPSRYLLVFLDAQPSAAGLNKLAAVEAGDEQFQVLGRELYLWMPGGIQKSVLSLALQRGVLGVTWTGRNWNTATKVLALLDA